jgi:hypothetical protein
MALDLHRQAELLMGQADPLRLLGRKAEAQRLYEGASAAEEAAFDAIPPDRVRTRGIIAVSAVVLSQRAGALDHAIRLGHRYLSREDLPAAAMTEIELLVDDLTTERMVRDTARVVGSDRLEWALRGPHIGVGAAPMDLVGQKIAQIEKLGLRVYEYLMGEPLRQKGPPTAEILRGLDILISQPSSGSFRFGVRFAVATQQLELFGQDSQAIEPEQVGELLADIVGAARTPETGALVELVPADPYRDAFLKLIRNIVPDGHEISEVEVRHVGTQRPSSTVLTPAVRRDITRHLRAGRAESAPERVIVDVLRGLNLNKGFIELGQSGREQRCWVGQELVLEDVVGPLVNRPVRVAVHRDRNRLVIEDIAPAEGDAIDEGDEVP